MGTHAHNDKSLYGYVPTLWICALYIALFSLTTLIHVAQAVRYRLWFLFPTVVLAGIGEVIGWSGRLWSSKNPSLLDPFLMQITTTIIAPTPLVAANFVILGVLIRHLGTRYSRLGPNWYTAVFCSADIIALIVQAVGGASASQAVQSNGDPEKGGHIMLGGIVFQLVAITVYVALATEIVLRFSFKRPIRKSSILSSSGSDATVQDDRQAHLEPKIKLMLVGLSLSTFFIFIRSIYRTIELSNGWTGVIIHTQALFNVLDGAMIVLAMFTMNFFHPGLLLGHVIDKHRNSPSDAPAFKDAESGYFAKNASVETSTQEAS